MRSRWVLVLCLAVLGTLPGAGVATGPVPSGDSVIGEAGRYPENGRIDARSGPNGENPTGWIAYDRSFGGRVTCLDVDGDTAVVGFSGEIYYGPLGINLEQNGIVRVVDNGPWLDYFGAFVDFGYPIGTPPRPAVPAPTDCLSYPGPFEAYPAGTPDILWPGGLVVTDAPVPTAPPPAPPRYSIERESDLHWVLGHGITLELTCESACRLKARLYLGARQARRYGLARGRKAVIVAKGRGRLTEAGDLSVIVTFVSRARRRLVRARALRVAMKTTATADDHTRRRIHPLRLAADRG
jgi:hypothetical protein